MKQSSYKWMKDSVPKGELQIYVYWSLVPSLNNYQVTREQKT